MTDAQAIAIAAAIIGDTVFTWTEAVDRELENHAYATAAILNGRLASRVDAYLRAGVGRDQQDGAAGGK